MESLLTPSESLAFQSFLSSIDYPDSLLGPEWAMYGNVAVDDDHSVPHTQGKEALSKATKDLMSLDPGDGWHHPQQHQLHKQQQQQQQPPPPSFPFLKPAFFKPAPPPLLYPHQRLQSSPPLRTVDPSYIRPESSKSPYPSPPAESPSYPQHHKRPPPHEPDAANKRPRRSPSTSAGSTSALKPFPTVDTHAHAPPAKPTLLSPSQKKANHIQSEQKRRANIRRGYEALCETVPALREAIVLEEQEMQQQQMQVKGKGRGSKGGKKGKGRKGPEQGDESERVDGRAGPRSENVVLQKTIDYIQDLLSERASLLTRLQMASSALPLNSPYKNTNKNGHTERLWEREWTGGDGGKDEDDDEEDDD